MLLGTPDGRGAGYCVVALLALQVVHLGDPGCIAALHVLGSADLSRLGLAFSAGATIAAAASLLLGGFALVGPVAVAYLVLLAAARPPARPHAIGAGDDWSHGVHLHGFLAEQVLAAARVRRLGIVLCPLASFLLATGAAAPSRRLVERHALAPKDIGSGRGLRHRHERERAATVRSGDGASG